MIADELTCRSQAATNSGMQENDDGKQNRCPAGPTGAPIIGLLLAIVGAAGLSGCISVNAPDKPIVIELNMNITMDVVYKLSSDATRTVDTNKDIF